MVLHCPPMPGVRLSSVRRKMPSLNKEVRVTGACLGTCTKVITIFIWIYNLLSLRWDPLPSCYTVKRRWNDIQKPLGRKSVQADGRLGS